MATMLRARATAFVLLLTALFAGGCAAPPFDAKSIVQEWAAFMERDYVLKPGDKILVTIYPPSEDLPPQEISVSPSGTVNLNRIPDSLGAAGKSIAAFRREIQATYGKIMTNAEITVTLMEAMQKSVYVTGEVKKPGVIPFVTGMTAAQVIAAAGGLDIRAKWSDVRILRYYGKKENRTYRVDVNGILLDGKPDFLVLPNDVIYCQTKAIADINDVISLYLRNLLPFQLTGATLPTN